MSEVVLKSVLTRARQLVVAGWCQTDLAQEENGSPVLPWDGGACRYCLVGALARAAWDELGQPVGGNNAAAVVEAIALSGDAQNELETMGLVKQWGAARWNDYRQRRQDQVVRLLDRAIRKR